MQPEREWKLAADWQLTTELEYWSRAIAEVGATSQAAGQMAWYRDGVQAELARRSRLDYERSQGPVDLKQAIEDIKARADLLSIFGQRLHWLPSGAAHKRVYAFLCFIHHEKRASLMVWPDQNRWWCFGCQVGGDAITAVMRLDQIGFMDALHTLGREYGVTIPEAQQRPRLRYIAS